MGLLFITRLHEILFKDILLIQPQRNRNRLFLKKPAIVSVKNVLYGSALVRFTACPGVKICKSSLHISVSRRGNFVVSSEIF